MNEDIIKKYKDNLSDDLKHDINYLQGELNRGLEEEEFNVVQYLLVQCFDKSFSETFTKYISKDDVNSLNCSNKSIDEVEIVLKNFTDKLTKVYNHLDINVICGSPMDATVCTAVTGKNYYLYDDVFYRCYMDYADILYSKEKYKEAIKVYETAIKWNPARYEGWENLIILYSKMNNFNKYKKTIIDSFTYIYDVSDLASSYFYLADYYISEGDLNVALSLFNEAIKYDKSLAKKIDKNGFDNIDNGCEYLKNEGIPLFIDKKIIDSVDADYLYCKNDILKKYHNMYHKKY